MIGLLLRNPYLFLPMGEPQVNLAYPDFITQVQAGNVTHVQIVGDQITGSFDHQIRMGY